VPFGDGIEGAGIDRDPVHGAYANVIAVSP
jgi:hypothetical protein